MANVVIGNQTYVEQPQERTWDKVRGSATTRRFKGDLASLQTLKNAFDTAGWATRIIEGGPASELECTIAQDVSGGNPIQEQPVNVWELTANVAEKDLLQAPTTVLDAVIADADDTKRLRDLQKGNLRFEALTSADFNLAASWRIAKLIEQGVQAVQVYQPILRHTQSVGNYYVVPWSLRNVGLILSTSVLLRDEPVPASLANNIPASTTVNRDSVYYVYGWLKTHPTINYSPYQRIQIVQEWQWGLWASDIYNAAS